MDERLRVDQRCRNIEQEWYENKQILFDMLRDASKNNFIELLVTVNTTVQPHQRFPENVDFNELRHEIKDVLLKLAIGAEQMSEDLSQLMNDAVVLVDDVMSTNDHFQEQSCENNTIEEPSAVEEKTIFEDAAEASTITTDLVNDDVAKSTTPGENFCSEDEIMRITDDPVNHPNAPDDAEIELKPHMPHIKFVDVNDANKFLVVIFVDMAVETEERLLQQTLPRHYLLHLPQSETLASHSITAATMDLAGSLALCGCHHHPSCLKLAGEGKQTLPHREASSLQQLHRNPRACNSSIHESLPPSLHYAVNAFTAPEQRHHHNK
ncbi:hypothetical protein DEO72_LG3g1701 [Vigna unguiculata]|uniref:Uncharacterized protein n=1 Tax=Vigna unguiculata TaxID=3917 RepID=A0A4D6LF32_VIGUN|nr:hypothetical protein DEO72_LG3g1701 [Vigna unguiculata]